MAILSKRILTEVGRLYSKEYGLRTCYMDLTGNTAGGDTDTLADLQNIRRKRDYALQESVRQMRGTAAAQVRDAKISIAHGVGGMFAASGTIIFTNEK